MTHEEFFELINNTKINANVAATLKGIYTATIPDSIKQILSLNLQDRFIDEKRLLSIEEITAADRELGTSFLAQDLIPIFDNMDNDFIVYDLRENTWAMLNIVDMCKFGLRKTLAEYFK